jgi:hypothetical protein
LIITDSVSKDLEEITTSISRKNLQAQMLQLTFWMQQKYAITKLSRIHPFSKNARIPGSQGKDIAVL